MEKNYLVRYNISMNTMRKLSDVVSRPAKSASSGGQRRPDLMKKSWLKTHRRLVIIVATALVVVGVAALLLYLLISGKTTHTNQVGEPIKLVEPTRYYSPLTGRETTEPKTASPVLAVMIENSLEARPQSGLTDAGVVFEAVAEGGITRFIALYQESEPLLIGPVRSVRPYYLDWAAAFDAGIAHVGGSDAALQMVRSGNYGVDLDQFFNDAAYWRSKDRRAPHNVYTDYAHLSQLIESKGQTRSQFTGFARQVVTTDDSANQTEPGQTATTINLAISSSTYNVS